MAEPKENPVIEKVLYIQRNFPGLIENLLDELFQNFSGQRRIAPERPLEEPKADYVDSTGYRGETDVIPQENYLMGRRHGLLPRRTWRGFWSPIEDAIEREMGGDPEEIKKILR